MIWNREPAVFFAVVQAVLMLAVAFGFDLTDVQIAAILTLTSAVLALVVRSKVTPTVT